MNSLMQDYEEMQKHFAMRPQEYPQEFYDKIMNSSECNPARQKYVVAFQLYLSGMFRSAIGFLDQAINLNPNFADAYDLREQVWHQFLRDRIGDERGDRHPDYTEYTNSEAWRAQRKKVLECDANLCVCGAEAQEVHHKTYENIGKEPLHELVSLCKECHARFH